MAEKRYVIETIESLMKTKMFLTDDTFYAKIAERFVDYVQAKFAWSDLQLSKRFYVGLEDTSFFQFCLENKEIAQQDFDTALLTYRRDFVYIKYAIYNNINQRFRKACEQGYEHARDVTIGNACEINTSVADMARFSNSVVRIVSIINLNEKQSCEDVLKQFCDKFKGVPIVLEVGYLFARQYGEYYDTGNDKLLDKLENLYSQHGFRNVNDHIGCYEEQITMVNGNDSDF